MNATDKIVVKFQTKKSELELAIQREEKRVEELSKQREPLAKELIKLEKLARTLEESQVSSDLGKRIADQRTNIAGVESAVGAVSDKIVQLKQELSALEPSLWLLQHYQSVCAGVAVPEIDNAKILFAKSQISIRLKSGIPISIEMAWHSSHRGRQCPAITGTFPIASDHGRVIKGYMPDELRWIPTDWLPLAASVRIDYHGDCCKLTGAVSQDETNDLSMVYFLRDENRLMPSNDTLRWQVKNPNYYPSSHHYGSQQQSEWINQQRAIGEKLASFEQIVAAAIPEMGGELDLNKEYPLDSLAGFVQDLVLKATLPRVNHDFPPNDKPLKSDEIAKLIKPHWELFVTGPWLPEMDGLLANLKYYCESGERPRFFSLGIRNSFGFRLRTRDHSWIMGSLFILSESNESKDKKPTDFKTIQSHYSNEDKQHLFRIGPMCVKIGGEERIVRKRP